MVSEPDLHPHIGIALNWVLLVGSCVSSSLLLQGPRRGACLKESPALRQSGVSFKDATLFLQAGIPT